MKKNKKGLSDIIATVLLLALLLAIVAIVWGVVANLAEQRLKEAEACAKVFDEVKFERAWTCFDHGKGIVEVSVNRGDIELDKIIIAISTDEGGRMVTIEKELSNVGHVSFYEEEGCVQNGKVKIPGKRETLTYCFNMSSAELEGNPNLLQLIPVVQNVQCEPSDTITTIGFCKP